MNTINQSFFCRVNLPSGLWILFAIGFLVLIYWGNNLFHIPFNRKKSSHDFIFDQNTGNAAQMKLGFFKSGFNGCGWIATHNALLLLGKKPKSEKIITEYELTGAVLFGLFGISPLSVALFFRRRGYPTVISIRRRRMDSAAKEAQCSILYYWHRRGAHYIACRWDGNRFVGYNTWLNSTGPEDLGPSLEKKFSSGNRKPRVLISVSRKSSVQ